MFSRSTKEQIIVALVQSDFPRSNQFNLAEMVDDALHDDIAHIVVNEQQNHRH